MPMLLCLALMTGLADDPKPVSFMKDVAPVLVRNCIACHNARKAESKYNMVNFAALAKGGAQGVDITLEAGKPEDSRFVELLHVDAKPRMPYKQEPLPTDHRYWRHPQVTMLPHAAAMTDPRSAAKLAVDNIRAWRDGLPVAHRVQRGRGY